MIEEITIQGYKSIKELNNFKLNKLNVLIGANGSGKSNFLGVFKLLRQVYYQNLQKYTLQRGGADNFLHFGKNITENIFVKLNFGYNEYDIKFIPSDNDSLVIQYEYAYYEKYPKQITSFAKESEIKNHIDEPSARYRNYLSSRAFVSRKVKQLVLYHFHDTSIKSPIKSSCANNVNQNLREDANNIAPFLYKLKKDFPEYYKSIVDTIQLVAPFFYDFVTDKSDEYLQLEWYHVNQKDKELKAHLLSDGTLRFICLATLLMQPEELMPDTIFIDEPELGLHPYAINILAEMLKLSSKQVIVSTQSVELINQLSLDDIIVVDQNEGISSFTRYNQDDLKNWMQEYKYTLGELWKSNIIGGTP